MIVHTVGHSTRSSEELLALLDAHGIAALGDVRRHPGSRRHPHFGRDALAATLAASGRAYEWLPELGGRRKARPDSPHRAWQVETFRAYADHMETPEFTAALDRLLALAARHPTAIMCAEAVPWRCHRQLIADALVVRGVEVRHILGGSRADVHRLTGFARVEGERVVYDGGEQLSLIEADGGGRGRGAGTPVAGGRAATRRVR